MSEKPAEKAGRTLRDHVHVDVDERAHIAERTRFIEAASAATRADRSGPARRRVPGMLLALAVCAAVAAWGVQQERQRPLSFGIGAERRTGVLSEYIMSPTEERLPLYFSDGTALTLDPATRARVEHATPSGATVLIEDGAVDANVVHRSDSDWTFRAGPYAVHVTGTSFVVSWHVTEGLDVRMRAGTVVIQGPGVERGFTLRGHEHFASRDRDHSRPPAQGSDPGIANAEPAAPLPAGSAPHLPEGSERAVTAPPEAGPVHASPRPESPSLAQPAADPPLAPDPFVTGVPAVPWSVLVARGEYGRVLEAAKRAGTESVLRTAGDGDLEALADAARLSGERALAEQAMRSQRARFPGSAHAVTAAFLLGRMADDAGSPGSAVKWYEAYLTEAPGGAFAAEALGRRMLALRRLNEMDSARRAALDYLQRFPEGPHARVAREIAPP